MIWRLIIIVVMSLLFIHSCNIGIEREIERQCIVAEEHCRLYADKGACDPKYMRVCELP